MIEKTFIYPRYNFTDLAPIRVVINEENGAILLNIEDLGYILSDKNSNKIKEKIQCLSGAKDAILAEWVFEVLNERTNCEDLDFINWLTYELMPNIINGINQFNMPVEVIIKHE